MMEGADTMTAKQIDRIFDWFEEKQMPIEMARELLKYIATGETLEDQQTPQGKR